jgi:hypothetical protein
MHGLKKQTVSRDQLRSTADSFPGWWLEIAAGHSTGDGPALILETEASSQRDDTAGETTRNRAEVCAANVVLDLVRVEVQIVE